MTPTHYGEYTYSLCEYHTRPLIHSPAVYGRSNSDQAIPSCDLATPSVVPGDQTYSLLQLEQSLFHKPAFWAIPGFEMSSDRERTLWDFLVQKVLGHFSQPIVLQEGKLVADRNHMGKKDTVDLLRYLRTTDVRDGKFIVEIVKDLLAGLHARSLGVKTSAWLNALQSVLQNPNQDATHGHCLDNYVAYKPVCHLVDYQAGKVGKETFTPTQNQAISQSVHARVCKNYLNVKIHVNFEEPWIQFDSILLLVVFNKPHYESIPYLEVIYRPFFSHILYCGPNPPSIDEYPDLAAYNFSFISYRKTPRYLAPGYFNYECTQRAVHMGYSVEGFLVIADDVLLATHIIETLHPDKVWYLPSKEIRTADIGLRMECREGRCGSRSTWPWFKRNWTSQEVMFEMLEQKQRFSPTVRMCYRNLVKVNGAKRRLNGAISDYYYIPTSISKAFAELVPIFLDSNVFLEIAVPTILQCLAPPETRESVTGHMLWGSDRNNLWKIFNAFDMVNRGFIHPTKWGYLYQGEEKYMNVSFFCSALMFMHDPNGQITPL